MLTFEFIKKINWKKNVEYSYVKINNSYLYVNTHWYSGIENTFVKYIDRCTYG